MSDCPHTRLELLPAPPVKKRCRHCHLTIDADELGDGYCPECFAATGRKRSDFDPVAPAAPAVRYRCEQCGMIIDGTPDEHPDGT